MVESDEREEESVETVIEDHRTSAELELSRGHETTLDQWCQKCHPCSNKWNNFRLELN